MTHENKGALRLSFEYFPPTNDTANERLWRAISRHGIYNPEFISITFGAAGTTRERSLHTLRRVKKNTRLNAAGHLTTIGGTRDEVLEIARKYREIGVNHIVALRGDKAADAKQFEAPENGFNSSIELIEALKALDFEVSVGAYPEKHPEAESMNADLEFLKRKFEAGADRAITQFFFEKDKFLRFRDQAQKLGINAPLVPGILPIDNFQKIAKFAAQCGTNIPYWLSDGFNNARTAEDAHLLSVSIACDMIENLRAEGVEHVHIYTLNNPDLVADICAALGLQSFHQSKVLVA